MAIDFVVAVRTIRHPVASLPIVNAVCTLIRLTACAALELRVQAHEFVAIDFVTAIATIVRSVAYQFGTGRGEIKFLEIWKAFAMKRERLAVYLLHCPLVH